MWDPLSLNRTTSIWTTLENLSTDNKTIIIGNWNDKHTNFNNYNNNQNRIQLKLLNENYTTYSADATRYSKVVLKLRKKRWHNKIEKFPER